MNKYSNRQHILFLPQLIQGSAITTVFDELSLCTGCILGYIAMEIIAYATVMNANRPDRSLAMSPYLPRQLRNDIIDLRGGAPLLLRRILRGAVSLTLRTKI